MTWYLRRGRIDRKTYWLHYFVPILVIGFVAEIAIVAAGGISTRTLPDGQVTTHVSGAFWFLLVLELLLLVPSISSQVTRLHDRGHSAWWLLFILLPIAGPIVLLVQMCLPGDGGSNGYGPPPGGTSPVRPDPAYPVAQS